MTRGSLFVITAVATVLVLAGCTSGPGTRPDDTAPAFSDSAPDYMYTVGVAIQALTLPEATGGNGTLTYSLGPMIPDGLIFDAMTRMLSGTPTTAGTYDMTYTAQDGDDNTDGSDAATQTFTIAVQPAHVGTWHFAGVPSPTTLTFDVDTFTLTVGDGITALVGTDGEESPITRITVNGAYTVLQDTVFSLTVTAFGEAVELDFVPDTTEEIRFFATQTLRILFQAVVSQPIRVVVDANAMTVTGTISVLVNPDDPVAPLMACRDAPCEGS